IPSSEVGYRPRPNDPSWRTALPGASPGAGDTAPTAEGGPVHQQATTTPPMLLPAGGSSSDRARSPFPAGAARALRVHPAAFVNPRGTLCRTILRESPLHAGHAPARTWRPSVLMQEAPSVPVSSPASSLRSRQNQDARRVVLAETDVAQVRVELLHSRERQV